MAATLDWSGTANGDAEVESRSSIISPGQITFRPHFSS